MKKIIISMVAVMCALAFAFSFAGCRKNKNDSEGESYPSVYVETDDPVILDEIPLED